MFGWLERIAEPAGTIGDLIAFGAYIYGFLALLRARSRYLERRRLLDVVPPDGTVAVSIGVGLTVKADVERYLRERFPSVPVAVDYHRPGVVSAPDFPKVIREIRDAMQAAMSTGTIRKAMLFYGGPSAIMAALGALADNWVPVDVFQLNQKSRDYEYTFTLDLETVKGL